MATVDVESRELRQKVGGWSLVLTCEGLRDHLNQRLPNAAVQAILLGLLLQCVWSLVLIRRSGGSPGLCISNLGSQGPWVSFLGSEAL